MNISSGVIIIAHYLNIIVGILLQRNDLDIWTMGSGTCRSWKRISPDAVCSRNSGTVQDKHKQGSTHTINITAGTSKEPE